MLSPSHFKVDEAWVLFRLNKSPVRSRDEGDFDVVTLMDAASGCELWRELLPLAARGSWDAQARRLLETAIRLNKKRLPKAILVTRGVLADFIRSEAVQHGIRVKSVPLYELRDITAERRHAFARKVEEGPRP
jgi:hypothetical protein